MRRRLLLLSILAASLPGVVWAEEAKKEKKTDRVPTAEPGQRYVRLPPIVLELYDRQGQYHMSMIELTLLLTQETKVSEKKVSDRLRMAFNVIPYEEYTRSNSTLMVKNTALDLLRQDYGAAGVLDVLIAKMMFR